MSSLPRRPLALAFTLLLALPPGWCCLVPPPAAPRAQAPPCEPACPSCCCDAPGETPHEAPPPRQPCPYCWCADSGSAVPPSQLTFTPDLPPADLLPLTDDGCVRAEHPAPWSLTTLPPPTHLLHCVWLC